MECLLRTARSYDPRHGNQVPRCRRGLGNPGFRCNVSSEFAPFEGDPHDQSDAAAARAIRTLEDLYKQLEPIRLGAGWAKPTPSLWAEPKKSFQPFVWSYAQAKGALDAAGRLINTELAERRNLIMQNPAGGGYATSRTIVAAYQMIMPGE